MAENKINTIKFIFNWVGFTPDHRQWKPSNPIIECEMKIAIDVPLTPDLIENATKISSQQLTNQKVDEPILTPLGMRYCIDQFETVMSDTKTKGEEETKSEDTSGWDDSEEEEFVPTGKAKAKTSEDDENWEEDTKENEKKKDEKWDENWEE